MREYIMTVIVSGVVGALVMQLAPSGEMKRYVKIAVSLVLVMVCTSPLLSLFEELREFDLSFLSDAVIFVKADEQCSPLRFDEW